MSVGLYIFVMIPVFIIAPLISLGVLRLYQGRKKLGIYLIGSAVVSFALTLIISYLIHQD